jgi:hypothetical protein
MYTAIIIEPRCHEALNFVLGNFLNNLNSFWSIIILYGNANKDFLFKIIKDNYMMYIDRIKLYNLNIGNLSICDYNKILFDKNFYNLFSTEYFLIFQTDTVICSKYRNYIYNFLKYDYVGAPWDDPEKVFNSKEANQIGNGGLSLRKKSKMLEIIEKNIGPNINNSNIRVLRNEDFFFTRKRNNIEINFPNLENAKLFSIETMYNHKSFGVHKPWLYLSPEDYNKLISDNPEVLELHRLNNLNSKIKKVPTPLHNLIFGKINYKEELVE